MPSYEITAPDGAVYQIETPEGKTEADALAYVRTNRETLSALKVDGPAPSEPPAQAPKPEEHPRWDVVGDIKRAASEQAGALAKNVEGAFPDDLKTRPTLFDNPMAAIKGQVDRTASALSIPLNAMGVIASPITGTARAILGSAISYAPWMDKDKADSAVDTAMMGMRPGAAPMAPQVVVPPRPGTVAAAPPRMTLADLANQDVVAAGARDAAPAPGAPAPSLAPTGEAVSNAAGRLPGAGAIAEEGAASANQNAALREITKRIESDIKGGGATVDEILSGRAEAPDKPLTLADLGGENLRSLGGNVARAPGPGREVMKRTLEQRDKAAGMRLTDDVSEALGKGSVYEVEKALTEGQSKAAAPLYDEAYAANQSVASPAIDRILNTPAGKKALGDARVKMQNDQTLMGVADADLLDQAREAGQIIEGGKGVASGLKLRTLDYVKRAMDDQIGVALRAGEKDDARILTGLKREFVRELDKADVTGKAGPNSTKPEGGAYERARKAYAGPAESKAALEWGQSVLKMEPAEVAAVVKDMTASERQFAQVGLAAKLRQVIGETGPAGDEARRLAGTDYGRQRIQPLFDNDAAFQKFIANVDAEGKMFRTNVDILGNSKSAARHAEDTNSFMEAAGHAIHAGMSAASGHPMGFLRAVPRMLNAMRDLRRNPEVNAEIARLLVEPLVGGDKPSGSMKMLQDLQAIRAAEAAKKAQGSNFMRQYTRQPDAPRPVKPPGPGPTPDQLGGGAQRLE